jgi:methylated-DNA-protein-cysteine methyltransferase related protein
MKQRAKSKRRSPSRSASRSTARAPKGALGAASLHERVLEAVRRIPRGRVSTYGNVAEVAGLPRRARLVGTVLRQTPAGRRLPWFRVINAGGRISFPQGSDAYQRQRAHLEAEGIVFVGQRIDLARYGWPPRDLVLDELLWKV